MSHSPVSDDAPEVIAAASRGDATSLDVLLAAHKTQVLKQAMRLCVTPEDAEDAVQETLLALSRSIGAFRGAAKLSTWLFVVTRRHCSKLAKRSLRHALRLSDAHAADDGNPELAFSTSQLREVFARVLAALNVSEREVLVRRDVLEQSGDEVAQALGISLAAVKSRLHRARSETRARLLAALSHP